MHTSSVERGLSSALLSDVSAWAIDTRRVGSGLGLAAIYGLAIGARYGLASMAVHAAGVPLALVAFGALAAPAFYIGVAHAGVPLTLDALRGSVARGIATVGLVLAGLAPAALLLTVTTESPISAAFTAALGLVLAVVLGLRLVVGEWRPWMAGAKRVSLMIAFVAFAAVLTVRVWWLVLPMLGRPMLVGGG